MKDDRPIALVGARGSGKTTVGRVLAVRLGLDFIDLDRRTSPDEPAGELLQRVGEAEFRRLEFEALGRVVDGGGPCVIATGGGVVETPQARGLLEQQTRCVWLRAEPEVLRARLALDATSRPALLGSDSLAEIPVILSRRRALYEACGMVGVEAGHGAPAEIATRVLEALESGR